MWDEEQAAPVERSPAQSRPPSMLQGDALLVQSLFMSSTCMPIKSNSWIFFQRESTFTHEMFCLQVVHYWHYRTSSVCADSCSVSQSGFHPPPHFTRLRVLELGPEPQDSFKRPRSHCRPSCSIQIFTPASQKWGKGYCFGSVCFFVLDYLFVCSHFSNKSIGSVWFFCLWLFICLLTL